MDWLQIWGTMRWRRGDWDWVRRCRCSPYLSFLKCCLPAVKWIMAGWLFALIGFVLAHQWWYLERETGAKEGTTTIIIIRRRTTTKMVRSGFYPFAFLNRILFFPLFAKSLVFSFFFSMLCNDIINGLAWPDLKTPIAVMGSFLLLWV